jgi:HAD superfamily hydrolase (TIGR01490 family)
LSDDPAQLALFDFDGTLTRTDTMFAFVRAVRGPVALFVGLLLLSPWLTAHRLGLLSAQHAKTRLLRWFFGGMTRAELLRHGSAFASRIDGLLRPAAMDRLAWHRAHGHEVWIVSASVDVWLRPWADDRGIRVLCTEAAFDGDVFRGALATPNCNGPEKERRIRAAVDLSRYATIYAYGDSAGDAEMLALADESWFRTFGHDPAPLTSPRATPEAPSTSET